MRTGVLRVGVVVVACVVGCAGPTVEGPSVAVDGKADAFGFELGIYSNQDYGYEEPSPLMVAFHGEQQGLPEGYAGHFDYVIYDAEEGTTEYSSGVFRLYVQEGRQRVLLESYDGERVGDFEWSVEERTLRLGEHELYRLHQSDRPEVLRQCEAFDVLDYELEESFTPWEYPSVDVEMDADGRYEVSLGCSGFDGDEDTIEVSTNEAGDFEARVTTSYGSVFVVQIPAGSPSRGRVLHGADGAEPDLMASLVCFEPAAPPAPPTPSTTEFTCTTRRPEAEGQTATIRFAVVDLEDREAMELYWPEELELPITVEPETSYAYTLVGGIADGYLTFEDGKLRIFTDQIGYELGELELYENSGFEHGYFRFELMDPERTSFYTEVDCELSPAG